MKAEITWLRSQEAHSGATAATIAAACQVPCLRACEVCGNGSLCNAQTDALESVPYLKPARLLLQPDGVSCRQN